MQWVPLASSIISLVFALTVLDQFFARRKPYQLIWSLGLFLYSLSTFCEFIAELQELEKLNLFIYRLWYLTGAIYVAAYLGMGTVYLLVPHRKANIVMAFLALASLYALIRVFTASVADLSTLEQLSGKAFPLNVRLITPLFNTFGTVALVGGAVYSAVVYWRRRIMPYRMVSNILIAVGAILPAFGGTLLRFGVPRPFYILELAGIILIFLGFLRSREVFGLFRFPLIHGFSRIPESQR